jgi:hypothetical protein
MQLGKGPVRGIVVTQLTMNSVEAVNSVVGSESDPFLQIRKRYLHFAEYEAKGSSPLYEELAGAIAESEALLGFIASLPRPKQQPNLVLAAVRHLYGAPRDVGHLLQLVERYPTPIRELILRRSTQTNEPARCATLLPILAQLPQPLALIEVGASAGLCLLPDYYVYDYGRAKLEAVRSCGLQAPVFHCRVNDATPIPEQSPRIVWRAGLDLNPVDVSVPEEAAWLETLVWPGQEARTERLRAAIAIAREVAVPLTKGDLNTDLPALVAQAPKDATLVVFHSAVLAYVSETDRERFSQAVKGLGVVWISNEAPGVFPWIAEDLPEKPLAGRFVLSINGQPIALTGPHGQSMEWLA